ncbi:MAG: hypothetical protein ACFB10_24510 [Salibacteraceae bacterium]
MRHSYWLFACLIGSVLLLGFSADETDSSPSLLSHFHGLETQFEITSNAIAYPVIAQAVVKRGYSNFEPNKPLTEFSEGGVGYGYGNQTLQLELLTSQPLRKQTVVRSQKKRQYVKVRLYTEDGATLMEKELLKSNLKVKTSGVSLFITYVLNLEDIPVILLDRAKKIDLTLIQTQKPKPDNPNASLE